MKFAIAIVKTCLCLHHFGNGRKSKSEVYQIINTNIDPHIDPISYTLPLLSNVFSFVIVLYQIEK